MTINLLAAIADERRTLADMFDTFTDEQWATPSLCEGWTVRHVAAHLLRVLLDTSITPRVRKFFGHDISGVTLTATDLEWSSGSGPSASGKAEDLILMLAGRRSGLDGLAGDGVAVLRERLAK
jgi:Mycothiol maleylpyruvate isomerase N-terminal domain